MKVSNKLNFIWKKHGCTILTIAGAIGVVATAIISGRDTVKAMDVIEESKEEDYEKNVKVEVVKCYIPTTITTLATITCIVSSGYLSKRTKLSMMGAYATLEQTFKKYRKNVSESFGPDVDHELYAQTLAEKYKECERYHEPKKELFYEEHYGEYFESTMEQVMRAEYLINRRLSSEGIATLQEFYGYLGLDAGEEACYRGWMVNDDMMDVQGYAWVEFEHDNVIVDDNMTCCIIHTDTDVVIIDEGYL